MAAWIDDATREIRLYFQDKKSQTVNSYKWDEAFIKTQTSNCIKVICSDWGGEFQAQHLINHQDQRGMVREFTVHDSLPQNGVAESSMRTQAEWAWALLIALGLPHFLWEEAMKHATWLQNRSPAQALDRKTPYEMIHKRKPNLAGIQEFGAAEYVKDLKAGKLDAHVQLGQFVGYDSESKGFRIYWPGKRSVTVERNVIFNESNIWNTGATVSIPSGALSKGEREIEKVIQYPENHVENLKKPQNVQENPKEAPDDNPEPKTSNTIPFPSVPEQNTQGGDENNDDEGLQHCDQAQRSVRFKGTYKGMTAALALDDQSDADSSKVEIDNDDGGYFNCFYDLPFDCAMVGHTWSDPQTLDEALRGPNAKEWQAVLDYEINRLQKFGTWVVKDLPKGQTAIPCSKVLQVKRGPSGEVQSYRVQIVTGGHK